MPRGNGKKNHSVNRERSYLHRMRHKRNKHKRREAQRRWNEFLEKARAYWRGEGAGIHEQISGVPNVEARCCTETSTREASRLVEWDF
jgi:hypothetical protein